MRFPPLDWVLVWSSIGLIAIGLAMVYSATSVPGVHHGLWIKQLMWAIGALAATWLAASIPYRVYDSLAYPLYVISLILLALVLVIGTSAFGAKRWLDLGPMNFQPSELAKIATVLVLARRFDDPKLDLSRIRDWLPPLLIVLVPFGWSPKEPDLGTSLAFPIMLIAMYFWAGMPVPQLVLGLSPVLNVVLFCDHRLAVVVRRPARRVAPAVPAAAAFTARGARCSTARCRGTPCRTCGTDCTTTRSGASRPSSTPARTRTARATRSSSREIAIGSGGVTGKGYFAGPQKALAFLPMRHTDFVYSVVGEELGLIGALTVVILYALLIMRGLSGCARRRRNGFASLMAVGLVTALFYHIMVNMLMTIGWAPVTGLPLPLLSYGGTALLVNGIQIGLLQNVALRRQEF